MEVRVGDRATWDAGWKVLPVTVLKLGKSRVTVITDGGHKTSVMARHLSPLRQGCRCFGDPNNPNNVCVCNRS